MVGSKLNDDRAERFPVYACTSVQVESDVAETSTHPRHRRGEIGARMRNPFSFLAPKISNGIQRLIRALKRFTELLVYKEEEKEMEIGYPTDVKHLTHIGWDGSTTTNPVKGWENLRGPELVASPSISLKQFELAMAAQAAEQHHHQTATVPVDILINPTFCTNNPKA